MNVQAALKTQYHASLAMLKQAVDECPDELWAGGSYPVAFWRVAYHTLFFTHLYLQKNDKAFRKWEHHREGHQHLGKHPQPSSRKRKAQEPYTKAQILEYWQICDQMVDRALDTMDLSAPKCGFWWYKLPKLDHQINNIRHIQHHTALLSGRLRAVAGKDIGWVGRV